jgi:hypothetical protein
MSSAGEVCVISVLSRLEWGKRSFVDVESWSCSVVFGGAMFFDEGIGMFLGVEMCADKIARTGKIKCEIKW